MAWAACNLRRPLVLEDQTLRDGLQILPRALPLARRLELLRGLADAGFQSVQIGSMARPDKMPQMIGAERLARLAAGARPGLTLSALVFNRQGLERALACGLGKVALSASLSEPHSRANLGLDVAGGLARLGELTALARQAGLRARVGLQCAFGGPGLAAPPRELIARTFAWLADLGAQEFFLADTAGLARPNHLRGIIAELGRHLPLEALGLHLHGRPEALRANLLAGWRAGVGRFDVTLGGLGGCPFLPGRAPGNLPAELAIAALQAAGAPPAIDPRAVENLGRRLRAMLDENIPPVYSAMAS